MSVNWNMGQPVNVMQSLQLLGASQDRARQQQQMEAQEQARLAEAARQAQFQQQLGGAIDPVTGNVNSQAARLAYINSGNAEGALKFGRDQQTDFASRRKQAAEPVAMAAMEILKLPPESQHQAFLGYIDQFSQSNPDAGQFRNIAPEQLPQFLKGLLAETGYLDDFMKANEPKEFNIGPGEGRYRMGPNGVETIIAPNAGEGEFGAPAGVPPSAADYLRKNPSLASDFDQKYGQGAAARVLGGGTQGASTTFPPARN